MTRKTNYELRNQILFAITGGKLYDSYNINDLKREESTIIANDIKLDRVCEKILETINDSLLAPTAIDYIKFLKRGIKIENAVKKYVIDQQIKTSAKRQNIKLNKNVIEDIIHGTTHILNPRLPLIPIDLTKPLNLPTPEIIKIENDFKEISEPKKNKKKSKIGPSALMKYFDD